MTQAMTPRLRRRSLLSALALPALLLGLTLPAVAHNPRGTAEVTISGKKVTISYGRPSLKGRDMLGEAQPGMVWRLGSEDATTVTTEGQLWFTADHGGPPRMVEPGSYSLFAMRTEDGWRLLVNSETGQPGQEHDPAKDLLGIPLQVETAEDSAEMFTITLASAGDGMNASLRMQWGATVLVSPLMIH